MIVTTLLLCGRDRFAGAGEHVTLPPPAIGRRSRRRGRPGRKMKRQHAVAHGDRRAPIRTSPSQAAAIRRSRSRKTSRDYRVLPRNEWRISTERRRVRRRPRRRVQGACPGRRRLRSAELFAGDAYAPAVSGYYYERWLQRCEWGARHTGGGSAGLGPIRTSVRFV